MRWKFASVKSLFCFIATLALATVAHGQQTVTEWQWNKLAPALLPRGGAVVSLDGRTALKIENTKNTPLQLPLIAISNPKISAQVYSLKGEIRYDGLRGYGVLDMWSYFPPAKPGGAEIQDYARMRFDASDTSNGRGASGWHPFSIPFNSIGATTPPTRLQINLLLGGRGTVYLGPVSLVQFVDVSSYSERNLGQVWLYGRTADPWWSSRVAVRATDFEAGLLLCLGFVMAGLCAKGKARELVVTLLRIHVGLGVVCAVAALAALSRQQPFVVWFPLSLSALILMVVYWIWLLNVGHYYRATSG